MPRTLLLALIATALTACNRSGNDRQRVSARDDVRRPPLKNSVVGKAHPAKATRDELTTAH